MNQFFLEIMLFLSLFYNRQIISYNLLGMPAPSLGMIMKICVSMETWLSDDSNNVVVVHCLVHSTSYSFISQTGKGRTLTICACLLAWLGWVENCSEALHLCCDRRGGKVEDLTTPSQRRYVQYFSMLLDCMQLKKEAFLLKSIKLTDIPLEKDSSEIQIDVFNCGLLIFATRLTITTESPSVNIVCGRLIRVREKEMNCKKQGNIIIRCRAIRKDGSKMSLFRCMFHTGYSNSSPLRFSKEQLDGACNKTE